jgi:8-oxo-dGTP diphosphatase
MFHARTLGLPPVLLYPPTGAGWHPLVLSLDFRKDMLCDVTAGPSRPARGLQAAAGAGHTEGMDEGVEARARYYASLATKRMGAGLVCRDAADRILLVQPTYKPTWEIPGGAVEADESPAAAVVREVREELGISLPVGPLLVVDWIPAQHPKTEGLMFLFDGGVLDEAVSQRLFLAAEELSDWAFVAADRLGQYVTNSMAQRLRAALVALNGAGPRYLERGRSPE